VDIMESMKINVNLKDVAGTHYNKDLLNHGATKHQDRLI